MKHFRGTKIALKSLTAHPLRVGLAILAIMIGVASVIVMIGIGRGAEVDIRRKIEAMGTNLLVVNAAQSRAVKGQVGKLGIMTTLVLKDAEVISEECPSIKCVAPAHWKKIAAKYENISYSTRIVGTVPAIQEVKNTSAESGTFFDDDENRLMAPVAVIGPTVKEKLFPDRDPLGESIRIGKVLFQVIGVTAPKGVVSGDDEDDQIFVPLRTAMNKLMNVTYLSTIFVEATGFENVRDAEVEIRTILRERHRLHDGKDDDFTIQNQADVIEAQSATARTFSLLVGSIALISLVVGGVGILGVMLLSIRERVGEVGIRRAVGAKRSDILVQFLVESSFLGVAGGIAGILLGIVTSLSVRALSGMPVVLAAEHVALSLVFSVVTGLVFGVYPSWKAAGMDPIKALTSKT
ncbi:ABC transporter permease [Desulfomonile tiedjei]|uniref:ABC-type antimicrobial peptide transport system, permease component n=1 Tax=Desulfomonile tiedjei (strain ATCC 49306 / DSM 6799 / DCB-1) TaxID=706587 RepID=I4C0V2_DESTA|nr:ABC transporter permease [Desulfomonile tiedjei]AFM23193.1 ABC-type antimicrobial peptide transport system, permease component [Desulfomonile tiedjei DSM 6799]